MMEDFDEYGFPWRLPGVPRRGLFYQSDPLAHVDAWVDQQLCRFRYKPGWRCVAESSSQGTLLRTIMETEDTYNPGRTVKITGVQQIPYYVVEARDPDQFAQWLLHVLISLEEHEAREWFRRDGEIFDNPHKPK